MTGQLVLNVASPLDLVTRPIKAIIVGHLSMRYGLITALQLDAGTGHTGSLRMQLHIIIDLAFYPLNPFGLIAFLYRQHGSGKRSCSISNI